MLSKIISTILDYLISFITGWVTSIADRARKVKEAKKTVDNPDRQKAAKELNDLFKD